MPAMYAEMREGLLVEESDFGTRQLRDHLKRKQAAQY